MAEIQTVARPYAVAAFHHAQQADRLPEWSQMLELAAALAAHPTVTALLQDPRVGRERATELFLELCGEHLAEDGANFIRALAEFDRIDVLPEVREQFEALKREAEAQMEVELVSAYALDEGRERELAEVLQRRLGRAVHLSTRVDASLIGGVLVRAGDQVIDASLRGKLDQLAGRLAS